ncbi:replicative DNA helicase [Enemella evansiae]|uniref:replicative DNA helicase n=1 Tax=Enemella evansiae TaxID=2016499 RepID=UPI00226CDF53
MSTEVSDDLESDFRPGPGPGPSDRAQRAERAAGGIDRTPPQDNEAEQSVLGAMLMSKDAIADVLEVLKGVDFYAPKHEFIFDAILDLYGRGEPADAVTVANELSRTGQLQRVGGHPYLYDLLASVTIAANAGYYAQIVRDKAILRRLVEASVKIAQLGYAGEGDVAEIVDRAQATVYSVNDGKSSEDYQPLADIMEATLDEIEAIGSRSGDMAGVPTGFVELDELTNGLHGGQMVILAARPAVGKALALDTPLPTPTGWTTMGEVAVGDELLGADGRPTRVVAATDVMTERDCYRITFSDGSTVIADAEHQWAATSRAARRAAAERAPHAFYFPEPVIERARELAASAATDPERLMTYPELVGEVGPEFRHVLHAVAKEVGVHGRELRRASGDERSYDWHAPVYRRSAILTTLAERVARPKGQWSAVQHPEIVTTRQIAECVTLADGRANWAVPNASPLELPEQELPLPAYALGVWLGDGHSAGARFTSADPEVAELVERSGVPVRPQSGLNYGLGHVGGISFQVILRQLGLLKNKHIPEQYLRGSVRQRLELLRGLLDTDGTVTSGGSVQLGLTNERLAREAMELVCSLGIRCQLRTKAVRGRTPESSVCYTLNFSTDETVFALERKRAVHVARHRKAKWIDHRYIRSIEKVPSVPVRCVEVDNTDHLYLATRAMIPTHNSTLGLDFARACSIKHGLCSAIFSLEMSKVEIVMRLLSAEAQIPLNHIRKGTMNEDDWQRLASKMAAISEAPLFIDDSPNLTMMEIRAKARRLKQRHQLKLIVIDYLQLMSSGKRVESRQLEVSEFSRQIKLLAKELDVPVVAMSQLNRGPEQRTDKKPMVSDLRESGSLEQDADIVILLHREDIYDKESARLGEADFIVAKNRNGPTRTIVTAFQGHYSRFIDMQH